MLVLGAESTTQSVKRTPRVQAPARLSHRVVQKKSQASQPREQRSFVRDRQANRVDGLNVQPLRLLQQIPPALSVVGKSGPCQLDVFAVAIFPGGCVLKGGQHSRTHFSGGRQGKGDGQDLFWLVYFRQQLQQAADEQLRLPRAGGSLDEKGLARVQSLRALPLIDGNQVLGQSVPPSS